jgi:hypothetical protein
MNCIAGRAACVAYAQDTYRLGSSLALHGEEGRQREQLYARGLGPTWATWPTSLPLLADAVASAHARSAELVDSGSLRPSHLPGASSSLPLAVRGCSAQQDIAGAFVRVRWTVAEEDRHQVDRAAIERLLEGAAETKLEGRILPVVRTRAAGISQLGNLADKVRVWAQVADSSATGNLRYCLLCHAALLAGLPASTCRKTCPWLAGRT